MGHYVYVYNLYLQKNPYYFKPIYLSPVLKSLFNKVADLRRFQMFSCEIYEIFKNTYFEEYLPTSASV